MKSIYWVALVLIVVGALNWGLVGAINFNLVDSLFGVGSVVSKIVYILVGVSGVLALALTPKVTGLVKG